MHFHSFVFNTVFIKKQILSIQNTLNLINNKPTVKEYNVLLNSLINNGVLTAAMLPQIPNKIRRPFKGLPI